MKNIYFIMERVSVKKKQKKIKKETFIKKSESDLLKITYISRAKFKAVLQSSEKI